MLLTLSAEPKASAYALAADSETVLLIIP